MPKLNHRLWWCFFVFFPSRKSGIFSFFILPNPNGGLNLGVEMLRKFIVCFTLIMIFMPDVFAKCSGSSWTYHPSEPGNNRNAWGCQCSENSKNYRIYKQSKGTKNLYDGSKNLCPFPKYAECGKPAWIVKVISLGIADGNWSDCGGIKWFASEETEVDSLPKNAKAIPTDKGWKWECNAGFVKSGKSCACETGKVAFGDSCITQTGCTGMADYKVQGNECVKQKWCRVGYDVAVHVATDIGDCMDYKCRPGFCFEASNSNNCVGAEAGWGGTYADEKSGVCIKCPKNQKATDKGCVAAAIQLSMENMAKCYKCDKEDEFRKCCQFNGKDGANGTLLDCAKCLDTSETQCWK